MIGGLGALYWVDSVGDAVSPVATIDEKTILPEPVEEQTKRIDPGSYFIFTDNTNTFYRVKLGESELVAFATIQHGLEFSGGLVAYPFGQEILIHRYQTNRTYDVQTGRPTQGEEQDGILSLTGEVIQVKPEQWGVIRSPNGIFEASFVTTYEGRNGNTNVKVTNLETQETISEFLLDSTELESWTPEPFLLDNNGQYLYARGICGCEATIADLWEVDLQTNTIRALDPLVTLQSWYEANIDPVSRRLLTLHTTREPSTDGPGEVLLPPTTVRLLDLDSGDITDLLVDDENAFSRPFIDPTGKDRYILHEKSDEQNVFLVGFDDKEITKDHLLTTGFVLDWVGEWLVIQDTSDLSLELFNVETGKAVEMTTSVDGSFEYIGSVTLD